MQTSSIGATFDYLLDARSVFLDLQIFNAWETLQSLAQFCEQKSDFNTISNAIYSGDPNTGLVKSSLDDKWYGFRTVLPSEIQIPKCLVLE